MPLRGDFNIEYDNDAELLLADMEFFDDDKESEIELKYQILELYNARLEERIKRKQFAIERGLLDIKKQQNADKKRTKEEKEIHNRLKVFMRFLSQSNHEKFVNGFIEERQLRQRLEELKSFRYS
jgi:transcriptional adapter 2-alpha